MHSTNQIIKFVLIMTTVVALALSLLYTGLKGRSDLNEAIYAKKAILAAVEGKLGIKASELEIDEISKIFNENIKQEVFDMKGNLVTPEQVEAAGYKGGLAENVDMAKEAKKPEAERLIPMYTYKGKGGEEFYIVSVIGKGLWDIIWGNIALEKDLNTIAGVDFDHKQETPGLGAEIKDNAAWKRQFEGKKIMDENSMIRGVGVIKGGAKEKTWQVDGISGATITADGVGEMLERGLKYYGPVLKKMKQS